MKDKMPAGKSHRTRGIVLVAVLLVLAAWAGCAGCIKNIQHLTGGEDISEPVTESVGTDMQTMVPTTPTPVPVPRITPENSKIVQEVAPILTPNPYEIQHAPRINATPQYAFLYRQPEFTKTYTLTGNAYGLLVNVVQGPLYIKYTINPKYDCLSDPDSCRGTVLVPVNRPYMTITVRDNQTGQIVARDGYGREFSSDTGKNTGYGGDGDDSSASTTYSSADQDENSEGYTSPSGAEDSKGNGPRYIPVYKEGQFQITIEGNYLDTTVAVITGTSPNPLDAMEKNTAGSATTSSNDDDW
ncbi:hypothetical protein [Methanoregula sp. UBA64]|jgi:hypothetical protein|uniref:hypothetical protein n=1 Tax=Methanoregula sp. UBA64 TaxID=1915554 RepID=UPI0025E63219|nr:hypothetical protein [Methanoregula sp. UBA64]